MEKITKVSGTPFVLTGNDIDTDRIIPARFLKCVTFDGLGEHAFEDDRKQLNGGHPFDKNKECSILVVGANFGCGSSREHAVPALTQRGIKAIIGLSFAEIFRGNAVGNGLVCVTVEEDVQEYISQQISVGAYAAHIDLSEMTIAIENQHTKKTFACSMPESHRDKLITGRWDDIATCLEAGDKIEVTAARIREAALAA